MSDSESATAPSASAPSLAPSLSGLQLPKAPAKALAENLDTYMTQFRALYASYQQSTHLRENSVALREKCMSTYDAACGARTNVEETLTKATEPTPQMVEYKNKCMEIRREHKGKIVGGIAVLSVASAILAPTKFEKVRCALRNLLFFGGGAAVLLYPEFAFPAAETAAEKMKRSVPRG